MYWTDFGLIKKASMDGTSESILHASDLSDPFGLTLDINTQTLYWTDYTRDVIEKSSTDGSNREILTRSRLSSPTYITYYDGNLYWNDRGQRYLLTTPVESPNNVAYFGSYHYWNIYASGVQVISPFLQHQG